MPNPQFSSETLQCQECNRQPATLFVTKTVGNKVIKQSLCEQCARALAAQKLGDRAVHAPLDEILRVLFQHSLGSDKGNDEKATALDETAASPDWWHGLIEYSADEDLADEQAEAIEELDAATSDEIAPDETASHNARDERHETSSTRSEEADDEAIRRHETGDPISEQRVEEEAEQNEFAATSLVSSLGVSSSRCPKCGTTWDRLKQDGRAGCAQCYVAFADELTKVLDKMQGASLHEGKTPRTLDKRHKRLMQLRLRRDHRLQMLNRRLEESLQNENYEEAAKLRDKIKVVSATVFEE